MWVALQNLFKRSGGVRLYVPLFALLVGALILLALFTLPLPRLLAPAVPTLSPERLRQTADQTAADNRPMQALYYLESAVARVGWTPELHQQAAQLWQQAGDPHAAEYHWQQATITSNDPLVLAALAERLLAREDWSSARDTLQRLYALQPDNTWANYHLGLLTAITDPTQAEPYLRQAALDPLYADVARAVRVTLLEFRALDDLDPTLPMLVGLTLVEYRVWDYAELAFRWANAISLEGYGQALPEALAYGSLAQERNGKDGTVAIFEAVRLAPQDAQIRFLLALHYRRREDYSASLNALIQAVSLAPENPALYAELGTAYRLSGDLPQAERWLQAAVAFSGGEAQFQALLDDFYAAEGDILTEARINELFATPTPLPPPRSGR
jgi:Flp pilus assembly protein TadD